MNKCPNCEYHKESARMWRQEAYKLSGHPLNDEQEQGASMTDLRKAAEMALEALERGTTGLAIRAIPALRQALAQPEQEPINKMPTKIFGPNLEEILNAAGFYRQPEQKPVAWLYNGHLHECDPSDWAESKVKPLYTAPPKREWVGLTDDECDEIWGNCLGIWDCLKMTEAKLKEKNT